MTEVMFSYGAYRFALTSAAPQILSDGLGNVYGKWVIERMEETQSVLMSNGAPRKITFRLSLARYGDDR